jgi:hypothetical protein
MVSLSFQICGHFFLFLVLQTSGYKITKSFFVSHWRFEQLKTKVETKMEGLIPFKTKNLTTPGKSIEFGINYNSQSLIIFVCFVVCHVEISHTMATLVVFLIMLKNTQ